MPDPFETLRLPLTPAEPASGFAARLRTRVGRALDLPKGMTVSNLVIETPTFAAEGASITPYLAVAGARAAIDWYVDAFGARLVGDLVVMPDGRVGHCELEIGGARLFLSEEHPEIGVSAPVSGQASVTLYLEVGDADYVVAQAARAGAHVERGVADFPYGRVGVVRDPFGHRWMVRSEVAGPAGPAGTLPERPTGTATERPTDPTAKRPTGTATERPTGTATERPTDPTAERPTGTPTAAHGSAPTGRRAGSRHGDIGYASLWVRDAGRAAEFFGRVLGWRPVLAGDGYQVEGRRLHHGIHATDGHPTLFLAFEVRDVAEATRRVREEGGEAGEVTVEPWGLACMCTDNQGAQLSLYQPAGTTKAPADSRARDLAYVTMEVPDSAKARAFYASVLGWRFSEGSVPDGWRVEGPEPMVGLAGGHQRVTNVPVYQTGDIAVSVALVREAGGRSNDPGQMPYGLMAECTDDQGTRFGLWQP